MSAPTKPLSRRHRLAITFIVLFGTACTSARPFIHVRDFHNPVEQERIRVGDKLAVIVKDQKELSGKFDVEESGVYLQPVVGEIRVVGDTPGGAAHKLASRLDGIVVGPVVSITIISRRLLSVIVLGEIRQPGKIPIEATGSLLDVLAGAGGLTQFAADDGIFVLRRKPELIRIRFNYSDLTGGDPQSLGFRLHDGDTVVVE